jgi:endoglucanase
LITITNRGTTAINGWTLEFDFDRRLPSIWNGSIQSHVGDHYAITAASWNRRILPGQSITFGFMGVQGNVIAGPTGFRFNGEDV